MTDEPTPPAPAPPIVYETAWFWRRSCVIATLASSLLMLWYLAIWGDDGPIDRDLGNASMLIIMTVMSGYLGVAAWDDRNKMRDGRVDGSQ